VDVIDLYQMHWPAGNLAETLDGWAEMARLKEQGKVRWIGVSNFSVDEMRAAQAIAPITSLQPPYSLIRRKIEAEVLPFCAANRIGTLVYSPMGSGLLTGAFTRDRVAKLPADDWRRNNPQFQEPQLTANLALVDRLQKIAKRRHRSPGEVAIAWTLQNPAVTGAIVGARGPKQVEGTFRAADLPLTAEDVRLLEA
jgi:aryl-alcohol dehydrogenase-like predicted oxidoreductase